MTTWRYIKGSEKDFEDAPDWANLLITGAEFKGKWFLESFEDGKQKHQRNDGDIVFSELDYKKGAYKIIAQREPVATNNSKYNRPCKGITIDVYDVLKAFNVTCPALQHLIKKALAVGQRGHKDASEDLKDILASAKRAIELSEGK